VLGGLQIKVLIAGTDRELDAALASLAEMRPDALMVGTGALFFTRADKIVVAAEKLAIPTIYFRREFALAGGLMSYRTNTDENFQVMGEYTGRILKGEKAGDLPIQQPPVSRGGLVVMPDSFMITHRVAVPPSIMLRADEVIE
jgi:putative ABC transport system substrate-binding protein